MCMLHSKKLEVKVCVPTQRDEKKGREGRKGREDSIFRIRKNGTYKWWHLKIGSNDSQFKTMPSFCIMPCSFEVLSWRRNMPGLLIINWAQIHKQSLAAIVYRGLTHTRAYQGKVADEAAKTPALLADSEHNLIKESLKSYFDQWAETCPVRSELHSY